MKVIILFINLLFVLTGCKEKPVEPPYNDLQPGRRDYVWKIDTLSVPPGFNLGSFSIWGSTATDVWGVNDSYSSKHAIWHYDGEKWSNDSTLRPIYPRCVFGFASNNIWIGNADGSIWHFDGNFWSKDYELQINGKGVFFQGIYGISPTNIFAVGLSYDSLNYRAVMVHYDGLNWKQIEFPELKRSLVSILYDYENKIYLIKGTIFNVEYEARLLVFDGKEIREIDSASYAIQVCSADGKVYIQKDRGFYKYSQNGLQKVLDFNNNNNFAARLWGNSENDFFTANWDGIGHYNGTDLITILKNEPNGWSVTNAVVFKKDAFFMCRTFDGITIVISGRLE
jgi:hypothetical protein